MKYFIFNASPVKTYDGKRISSVSVIKHRLASKIWPVYSGTAHKSRLEVGDLVVFYAAGYHTTAKHFIGSAKISSIYNNKGSSVDHEDWLTDIPDLLIHLDNVVLFNPSVSIKQRINCLSFIRDKKSWGISLQGGTRIISQNDFKNCLPKKN